MMNYSSCTKLPSLKGDAGYQFHGVETADVYFQCSKLFMKHFIPIKYNDLYYYTSYVKESN